MKYNKWTLSLASAGIVSLASAAHAEEAQKMSQVLTAVSSTTLSGYVDTSAIWKVGTGNANLPGRAFDGVGKLDGFNLNAIGIVFEKPLTEDQWAAGYRIDLAAGPDAAAFATPFKQAYVDVRVPVGNGLDVKMGVFNTVIGYESFESYLDPNFSRSFGWQLEPINHTGVLLTYKISDVATVNAGIANTWTIPAGVNPNARASRLGVGLFGGGSGGGNQQVAESEKTYMAALTITAPDSWGVLKGSSWYLGVINGLSGAPEKTTSLYAGASVNTPLKGLSVGGAFDYRFNGPNADPAFVGPTGQAQTSYAWAIAGYASFQATDKLKFNGRLDYTSGSDGTWYDRSPVGTDHPNQQNKLGSATLTADYSLWANVISRLELRWDRSLSGDTPYGGKVVAFGAPGGAPNQKNAVTVAANMIYKF